MGKRKFIVEKLKSEYSLFTEVNFKKLKNYLKLRGSRISPRNLVGRSIDTGTECVVIYERCRHMCAIRAHELAHILAPEIEDEHLIDELGAAICGRKKMLNMLLKACGCNNRYKKFKGEQTMTDNKETFNLKFDPTLLRGNEKNRIIEREDGLAAVKVPGAISSWADLDNRHELRVAVHDGMYHADDALSVALLKLVFGSCWVEIVRTRDDSVIAGCDFVVDVGEGLLDHHGARAFDGGGAACSRVLRLLLQSDINEDLAAFLSEVVSPMVDTVSLQDTGNHVDSHPFPWVHPMAEYDAVQVRKCLGTFRFERAVDRIAEELQERFAVFAARRAATGSALSVISSHPEAQVLTFAEECRDADVKKLLWNSQHPAVFYVSKEAENDYRVLCAAPVDQEFSYFGSKMLIPERFRGLRGAELSAACGIPGGIFCHAAGFIAGFDTESGAAAFAKLCLE
jgi:uncharacterized UPF0160 family protein